MACWLSDSVISDGRYGSLLSVKSNEFTQQRLLNCVYIRNDNMPVVSYVFPSSVAVFCCKAIRAARYRVVLKAWITRLPTQYHTGVQCDSLGNMKACRMQQRQIVFNADPKRLSTPSVFAVDFCIHVVHLRSWAMVTEMHVTSDFRTDGVVYFFLALDEMKIAWLFCKRRIRPFSWAHLVREAMTFTAFAAAMAWFSPWQIIVTSLTYKILEAGGSVLN